ncbi:MAG: sialidase family protein [Acidobacteria bacterium]|nr:sialidase family protein [Acidobacteriota bacterium]
MDRRLFLALPAAALAQRRSVFIPSPGKGTAIMAYAFYTQRSGGEMNSIEQRWSRSDTIDTAYRRRSTDYGVTWSAPETIVTGEKRPEGMYRKHLRCGYVDPPTGRYLEFFMEGVLPTDDPLEGMRRWQLFYTYAGKTHQVIHEGAEFSAAHPLPGVRAGKNSVMMGDQSCVPLTLQDGTICVPVEITPLGANGEYYNPGQGYTWHETAVLLGKWDGDRLRWRMSNVIRLSPEQSTRGIMEATMARLTDGRLLLVCRASNDKTPERPSRRWASYSSDGARTWSVPVPWTYEGGEEFFSPSSCSQLLTHSNGKIYWLGNITPTNPRGNRPRFPFVIGEVDRHTGLLRKATVRTVDTLQEGENEILSLSNFYAYEHRKTREIVVHMTRLFAHADGWEGDAMRYAVGV